MDIFGKKKFLLAICKHFHSLKFIDFLMQAAAQIDYVIKKLI